MTVDVPPRRRTGDSAPLRLFVLLLAMTLLAPVGLSKTFTAFPETELFQQNVSGTFYAEQHVAGGSGHAQVYAHGALGGTAESVVRVGATFVTNTGDTLAPYETLVSAHGAVTGTISCINFNGDTEGTLNLELQQWRLENAVWVLKRAEPFRSWGCPLVSIVADTFSGDRLFTFEPGSTYRVMLQALGRARSAGTSQATVDFCESGTVRCGVSPEFVQLQDIIVPNQAPFARFQDESFWYVEALSQGARVTGRACDIDGSALEVTVRVIGAPGATTTPIGAVCGSGFHDFMPVAPGFYPGVAEGLDNEGARGQDVGECRITVFPTDPIPLGFPDLAQFSPMSSFTIETLIAPDDSAIANRIVVDGQTVSDTLAGVPPPAGSRLAEIEYDVAQGFAAVTVDGVPRWSGEVVPEADPVGWWDVRPL